MFNFKMRLSDISTIRIICLTIPSIILGCKNAMLYKGDFYNKHFLHFKLGLGISFKLQVLPQSCFQIQASSDQFYTIITLRVDRVALQRSTPSMSQPLVFTLQFRALYHRNYFKSTTKILQYQFTCRFQNRQQPYYSIIV